MLHIIVMDLDMRAKEKFGCASHTVHTADEMFILGVQFKPDGETRKYRVSETVPTNDASSLTLFKAIALRGEQTIVISKVALLDVLGKCVEVHEVCIKCAAATYSLRCDKCKGKYLWDLKLKLQSRRFVLFLAFLIDMHALLERVSLIFQRDDLSIGDVGAEVNTAIDEIAKLAIACGKLESQVHNFVASGRGFWADNSFAITCDADDKDVEAHNADRLYLCRHLAGALNERFKSGLSDPIVMAFSALNHKWWPDVVLKQDKPDYLQLDLYGLHEISLIIENYKKFFADVTGKQVVDEWTAIKRMVVQKPSLMGMSFKRLWARMLSLFTAQFPLILRLVAIAMTFTTDTSGCERLISLMNDLQTEFQTRMEHDCLRSQMWWSTEMHRLTYSEWQAALPRMVRRWNKNRRHQRDDDESSAAAETAEAEASARCDPEYPGPAGQPCKTDSYADLCAM
jgi:hypothetical protein